MKELELSHEKLLVMIDQLNEKLQKVENANVRVKGKLQDIQEDLTNLVENQKKSEKKQKEKLCWLQEQLKTKEEEIKSQSEYFEHYKQRQRQQTAVLRKRECYLQGEVSRLEKQVLDLSGHVALLTSKIEEGMVQHLQQVLESAFSGTQGYKHPDMEVVELKTCIENVEHDVKSHAEAFQQNLKFLREKEEDHRREQGHLLTELQCSQDNEDFLRTKLEESYHHVYSLKLSEIKLQEKMEELLDENRALKDQGRVKLKKKKEKDSQLARLENRDNSVDLLCQLNGDLIQDEVQNLKWRPVLDSLRSRATQTPVVLLHAKESETPGCSHDGLKQMEEQPEEPVPVWEGNSSVFVKAAGLAEAEQVTLGTEKAGTLEDSFTLFGCTQICHAAGLLSPYSEKLSDGETTKKTKGEETIFLLKEQAVILPAKTFPACVVEALMRKKLQLTLFKPESCHTSAVTAVKKVISVSFCEANTHLWSSGFCIVAEGGFYDKVPALLHGMLPSTVTEIFTSCLEKYNMEKHWENKQILPKSLSENRCLDKVVDDEKYHQKISRERAKGEEIQTEKAQPQLVTSILEESSKFLYNTEFIRPEKQGMEAKERLGSTQDVKSFSLDFKDLKKCFEGSPELMEKENISDCISDMNRRYNGEDTTDMEEKGEQAQKPSHQTNPSSNIGMKEKKDQTLELYEPNEKNFSCEKIGAENVQYAYSQNFFWSDEERYPLKLLFPMQERVVCLSKLFLPWSSFYECFCHLSPLEAYNECNVKISVLEKAVAVCSQRIFLLMQENENYSKEVCILKQENERYAQLMCALEEEMDAYFQYLLAVDEANVVSFQNLLNEKEVSGRCYNNLSEENTMTPGTLLVETFSKNLPCIEEKTRNSEKDWSTIASNKLSRSALSLKGRKMRYFQLLSDLKEERSRCFKEIAKLLQDKENYVAKYNELIQEREETLQRITLSEGEKKTLLGHLAEIKCEQDKYKTLVSELQDCKTSCYKKISNLQEEKYVLKREIDRIKKETSEQLSEFQKANANFILENKKLKELVSSLGFTYEELRKEKSLGTKKKIVKLKEESQQHGLKPKKVETVCSATQTEEEGVLVISPSSYFPEKEGSAFESYSTMKEQVEKAKEELKTQQKELEKSKKEAQKWYRELGFAETRYEEIKARLTQVLAELDLLKQEAGDKILGKQHCKLKPEYSVKDAQEKEVNKIANMRLQQQVLTLKAQLRDQAALENQFYDLQNEVELLKAQLCEKMLPFSTDISQANGQPLNHETPTKVNGMTGSIPANSQQEADSTHSSHITSNVYAGSPIKLTSPERIIALHRELRQNHCRTYQIPSVVSSNSNPQADRNLPMIHKEAPWPLLSRMRDALVPLERGVFSATKGRDRLSKCDDVFWGQIGNQHAGATPQGTKQKSAIMNKAWLSGEKTDGPTSATTAKSYLSDVLSASNKG
ncbi:janus kinase and microtubule-interacting protein 1 isoform X3 [Myiozetetes cayanensis]|uniref:janus kinase and microtubule-interacting protein 1 isoform X3 n=1 Tax=Myiozetetes cayanensis TaxID=478635 RepID=UPI00215FDDC8|nr:janus kinase and microtubule-interacting protein 1 isoform X3 [Myiozetetes cayanensis]